MLLWLAGEAFGEGPVDRFRIARQDLGYAAKPVVVKCIEAADGCFVESQIVSGVSAALRSNSASSAFADG